MPKKRKNAASYEGGQYTGGRVKGRKNLKKTNGGFINEHGVFFTTAERKALENAANKANKRRTKMLKEEKDLVRMFGGNPTGHTIGDLQTMGREGDFILSRKSKSLQQFQTKESYEIYMRNLKRVNDPMYLTIRARQYKANFQKALKDAFAWDDVKDAYMKIQMMPALEFMKMVDIDEALEIGYIYEREHYYSKLNNIRGALGTRPLEWVDEYEEERYIDLQRQKQARKKKR